MESKRQQKYSKLIMKDLADLFQKDLKPIFGNAFVTIKNVSISPDLSVAKIHLSFLLVPDPKAALKEVIVNTKQIRQALGARIRHQARIIPELIFFLDESGEYAMQMDTMIQNLNIPKETTVNKDDYHRLDKKD